VFNVIHKQSYHVKFINEHYKNTELSRTSFSSSSSSIQLAPTFITSSSIVINGDIPTTAIESATPITTTAILMKHALCSRQEVLQCVELLSLPPVTKTVAVGKRSIIIEASDWMFGMCLVLTCAKRVETDWVGVLVVQNKVVVDGDCNTTLMNLLTPRFFVLLTRRNWLF
jgi:hypothetical protein